MTSLVSSLQALRSSQRSMLDPECIQLSCLSALARHSAPLVHDLLLLL